MEPENTLRFETKEEANERRIQETLNRTPHERLMFFLQMAREMQVFQTSEPYPNSLKNSFILEWHVGQFSGKNKGIY